MLKKCFTVAALLWCVTSSYALEGKLFFTLAPNVADEFVHIMPFRPPHIPNVTRCVRNQPIEMLLVLVKPATGKDGKVLVEIESIKSVEPGGKTKEMVEPGKPLVALKGEKKNKRDFSGVMLSRLAITMIAEDTDPLGKTRMTVRLRDKGDNSTLELSSEIELVEKLPGEPEKPMTVKEMDAFFTKYYHAPDPAKIPAAFEAFLRFDEESVGKKTYDPLMWLRGFAELYRLNPQLRPALVKRAEKCSAVHRQYVALILAEAGAKDDELAAADSELKRMFDRDKGRSPLVFDKITNPAQLDALWMEFFVTGKFEPIRRLVGELRKRDGAMTAEEIRKLGRKPNAAEMKKFINGIVGGAAEWSLASNAKQHKLVAFYLESMFNRREYPDRDAAVKLGRILINAGLLKVVDTPDGGKALRPVFAPVGKKQPSPGERTNSPRQDRNDNPKR